MLLRGPWISCVVANSLADSVSSVSYVTAGTPQGTVSGPNDFKLIINDLQFGIGYVKFADDTTTFSVSNDQHNCLLQKSR